MGASLSIDLASRRYSHFGIIFLPEGSRTPRVLMPKELGLKDPPEAASLAVAIESLARTANVDVVLLDGPQAWRYPQSPIKHMRLCERVLNTPGKTGIPGQAKPSTYLTYIQFSIDVFHYLRAAYGWSLLSSDWPQHSGRRWVVEVFPSAAWALLGLDRLPGKSRGAGLEPWRLELAQVTGYSLPSNLNHDQLQAAVVLPLGPALIEGAADQVILAGLDPFIEGDSLYEGLIANPRLPPN